MRNRIVGKHCRVRPLTVRTLGRRPANGPLGGCGVVAGIAVLLAAGGVSYAATTSNPQAAALYGESQAAMARYEGISFTGTGVSYKIIPAQGYDNFRFDWGTTPPGYKSAVDHVQVVQSGGQVTEEVDTLTAPGLPALRLWQHGPIGEVGEVMTSTPCAETIGANNASYVTVGKPFVNDTGYVFAALSHGKHGRWIVRSTWSLSGGTAHETDTISGPTHLWVHSHVLLDGGPYNGDTLTEKQFHYSTSQAYEPPAQLGRC